MANYFELKVPLKRDPKWSEWDRKLRSKFKVEKIPVRWQMRYYHMTLLFLYDDNRINELSHAFSQCMSVIKSFSLEVDKLGAFTTGDGATHIIYLTADLVPATILTLAQDVRRLADALDTNYDKRPFKPHVTLGRVSAEKVSLNQLKTYLSTIEVPSFNYLINETEHRYFKGDNIQTWKL